MIRSLKVVLGIGLAAALAAMAATSCIAIPPPNPWGTVVTSLDWPYSNNLTALVTPASGGWFHYEYTLDFFDSAFFEPLTVFSVGNMSNMEFRDADNNVGFENPIWNGSDPSANSVRWEVDQQFLPFVPTGQTVWFEYYSRYTYTEVSVTLAGGLPSEGSTLGMVPDPSSLAVLGVGLAGIGAIGLRRLRRSAR